MKLLKEQENLLKYVPSVEVRAKKRFLREKRIKQNELESIVWKLMINRNKRKRLLD